MIVRMLALFAAAILAEPVSYDLTPIRLQAGVNPVQDIAGDGQNGSISLDWRENGNAWAYDIFMVRVGGSIATIGDKDFITDQPHTGEDAIRAVRFARGKHAGKSTTFALVADRKIEEAVPDPAATTITIYALVANEDGIGTPYHFVQAKQLHSKRRYCNAHMALFTELRLPLPKSYDGLSSPDGC
ncbi:hypothetical protein [Sphingomonas xinjiangensis]|uniref:Uncharacterized protein n=1 Tax=Sphingomonas xinjiangensis TaxID=643568 RepID=A0A840Y995_9SPHN|nr:hypothetical protein [Sphingomonas xinjiangensis]MBB5708865.1 hypothetical protein [Sphingomonas xinjiangensis]